MFIKKVLFILACATVTDPVVCADASDVHRSHGSVHHMRVAFPTGHRTIGNHYAIVYHNHHHVPSAVEQRHTAVRRAPHPKDHIIITLAPKKKKLNNTGACVIS